MKKDNTYKAKLILTNEKQLKSYLKGLFIKYGFGNIPINEALNFNFEWGYTITT